MSVVSAEEGVVKRTGVLGYPIGHSLSPQLHNAGYRALRLHSWHYQRLPVPPELLVELVRALPQLGFVGVNVTVPHKEAALQLADCATEAARAIGAANTLTFRDGEIAASNTDAPAVLDVLPFAVAGRSAVVLGAGGSARAAVWALLSAGAEPVMVWNRTVSRAQLLCQQLGARPVETLPPADLLVNCTTVGMEAATATLHDLPFTSPHSLREYQCLVDLVYRRGGTALVQAARAQGTVAVDGLEILIQQGALSFEIWTDCAAPLAAMRQALAAAR